MKKKILVLLTSLLLTACGTFQSPFINTTPELQVLGSTKASDPERVLGTSFITAKYIRAGDEQRRLAYAKGLADTLDTLISDNATGGFLQSAVGEYVGKYATNPEDKQISDYLLAKLAVKTETLTLPLSPEKRRVIGVHAKAIRDTVENWE